MTALEFGGHLSEQSSNLKPFALKLTKDLEEANDLVQETILKAFSNQDKFENGTNLKAWLFTIMRNTFITNYQRASKRNTFIDSTDNLHFINSSESVTQNLAFSNLTMEDINIALANLGETYKKPFLMYYRGFKYHEIATKLTIPIGTVKNRIHIARKELQSILKKFGHRSN